LFTEGVAAGCDGHTNCRWGNSEYLVAHTRNKLVAST